MRSLIRLAVAGAVALPIVIGAAGVASADAEYDYNAVAAGPEGAAVHVVQSGADENGDAYFYEQWIAAGHDGAGVAETGAWVHGDESGYFDNYTAVGEDGAFHSGTSSSADGETWDDDYDGDDHYDDDYDDEHDHEHEDIDGYDD